MCADSAPTGSSTMKSGEQAPSDSTGRTTKGRKRKAPDAASASDTDSKDRKRKRAKTDTVTTDQDQEETKDTNGKGTRKNNARKGAGWTFPILGCGYQVLENKAPFIPLVSTSTTAQGKVVKEYHDWRRVTWAHTEEEAIEVAKRAGPLQVGDAIVVVYRIAGLAEEGLLHAKVKTISKTGLTIRLDNGLTLALKRPKAGVHWVLTGFENNPTAHVHMMDAQSTFVTMIIFRPTPEDLASMPAERRAGLSDDQRLHL